MSEENDRKEAKREAQRKYSAEHREYYREKRKRFLEANPEKRAEYTKRYYEAHKEEILARQLVLKKASRRKKRKAILVMLGGKCSMCGFSDYRALQIDHINNDGKLDRDRFAWTPSYYKSIMASLSEGDAKYQVLCANCHVIKHYPEDE